MRGGLGLSNVGGAIAGGAWVRNASSASASAQWWSNLSEACFPGAQGYGSDCTHGRLGTLIRVTSLNSNGVGSLRSALEVETGPRSVIFDVGGVIDLADSTDSVIEITDGFCAVYGETAPSPGITIRGGLSVATGQCLIRHIRVRSYDTGPVDTLKLKSNPGSLTSKTVLDHITASWSAGDETFITELSGNTGIKDCTISNSAVYQGLDPGAGSSRGFLSQESNFEFTIHRNSIGLHDDRLPQIDEDCRVVVSNILSYGPGSPGDGGFWSFSIRNSTVPSAWSASHRSSQVCVLNCSILSSTNASDDPLVRHKSLASDSLLYEFTKSGDSGNVSWMSVEDDSDGYSGGSWVANPPFTLPYLEFWPASSVEDQLDVHCGARPTDRDPADATYFAWISDRTGTWPTSILSDNCAGGTGSENTAFSLTTASRVLDVDSDYTALGSSGFYTKLEENTIFPEVQSVESV